MNKLSIKNVIPSLSILYNYYIDDKEAGILKELDSKKLIRTYKKHGYTVNVYKPVLSVEEQLKRDVEIKAQILKIAKA